MFHSDNLLSRTFSELIVLIPANLLSEVKHVFLKPRFLLFNVDILRITIRGTAHSSRRSAGKGQLLLNRPTDHSLSLSLSLSLSPTLGQLDLLGCRCTVCYLCIRAPVGRCLTLIFLRHT